MPVRRGALLMAIAVAVPSAARGGVLAFGGGLAGENLTRYETAHGGAAPRNGSLPSAAGPRPPCIFPEDSLFSRPLALHVRTPTSPTLAARYLDGLGWRLLTA